MNLFKRIEEHAALRGNQPAIASRTEQITYGQLEEASDRLAGWINGYFRGNKSPVVVYGHKSPWMAVCFLACAKSGRAYCPVDVSLPQARLEAILETAAPALLLDPESALPFYPADIRTVSGEEIRFLCESEAENQCRAADKAQSLLDGNRGEPENRCKTQELGPDQIFYIIFTSGSTGQPKGVEVTRACLEHFLDWSVELGMDAEEKAGQVFLNQAPFSFDLSVMDLYGSLACGGTLLTIDKEIQGDYVKLIPFLRSSYACVWVSTPSFAEICLAEPGFCQKNMDQLRLFLFCGETLSLSTADKLLRRFPKAKVINTYGPTESTVAVTSVDITQTLVNQAKEKGESLPVGRVKPGSLIEIQGKDQCVLPEETPGEIVILGNTVAAGYYQKQELTDQAFFPCIRQGESVRGYRTGDSGFLRDGMLYFQGRLDHQIKWHGYRIEIGDIEANLMRLSLVKRAVVAVSSKEGKVRSLTAYVESQEPVENQLQAAKELKEDLRELLPDYMIPKKICFVERMPVNDNGKIDRNALGGVR